MSSIPLSPNSLEVLKRRYLLKNTDGRIAETPEAFFSRVARHIASAEGYYGASCETVERCFVRFYNLLSTTTFLPNSPTLMNAGKPSAQLSACFVLPIEDTMESIFETLKHTALIHQSGGGTGFSFSKLRPKNDVVKSTMGVSSGPISFMEVYNAATEAIKQGGTRRGANMGILRIDHPDIEEFITCKNQTQRLTNFNLSVTVTDAFMDAVAQNMAFPLRHPNTGEVVKAVSARYLFEQILDSAWQTGEPGLVFIDTVNRDNPTPAVGEIEATNPCGEVPLLPYEACNLGSINLGRFVLWDERILDWIALAETVADAVRFLDNVITRNHYPVLQIQDQVEGNRKIGLGVMGWADALIQLGIPYDSEQAVSLARDVAAFIEYHSKKASVELAKQRGAFPNFEQSRYRQTNWLSEKHLQHVSGTVTREDWYALDREIHEHGLRNATTTCIAPTGTISIIAGASGGIEPLFGVVFTRNIMDHTELQEIHPLFKAVAQEHGFYTQPIIERIAAQGSIRGISEIPLEIRRLFVTAHDIAPEWHVKMQAAFQQFVDNGVSKTINFPAHAPLADVQATYWLAYQEGVKGITVYRDGSRDDQPMQLEMIAARNNCPECGGSLIPGEGCYLCTSCAFSACI